MVCFAPTDMPPHQPFMRTTRTQMCAHVKDPIYASQFEMVSMRSGTQITLMRSTPSLGSFPSVAFETVPMLVRLTMALSLPVKEDR